MRTDALRYFLLTGLKRCRLGITGALRGTPLWAPLRVAYHCCSPLWRNAVVRTAWLALRRRLYCADPRAYWQREGGSRYMQDEEFLLGPGSLTEQQG